ncbi:hypothetical protein HRUBRA_00475 [Pseudohaliea rubra DSM 19751]|uniref:DUF2490 domain-containing protein n=2 Tax=Pseudohaliea TaxID=1341120 RepID=A0A095VU70_9GAMM|nr:hypothetical protein HRUBRA_00475 [Pseudohaliea rubra DSM 19751]
MRVFPALLGALLFYSVLPAHAEPTINEYNAYLKKGPWTALYRRSEGTWHAQLTRKAGAFTLGYRQADLRLAREHRGSIEQALMKRGNVSLAHRLEYRSFDRSRLDDHWRYRLIVDYRHPVTDKVVAWVRLQPRLAHFGGRRLFDARDQVGLEFQFGSLRLSPFYERYALRRWDRHGGNVIGLHATIEL